MAGSTSNTGGGSTARAQHDATQKPPAAHISRTKDEADELLSDLTPSQQARVGGAVEAARIARINGTTMDGAMGAHVMGVDTPDAVGRQVAKLSRSGDSDAGANDAE